MIQWQFFFVSRMCILYCAMPLGCNKMICVAQPVFLFCSVLFRAKNTLYPVRCGGCERGTCIKTCLMQSWKFPYMYLYNIPTYFADIDGISHSFYTHKLHNKQGVKVI